MTQTVSYERASISLYLLQMANMPVASWKRVTNNHNQASNIRVCQPSVPSCQNISQISKIEQNKLTLKISLKKKKKKNDVFSSSHETLPSPFWHSWSAPLLLVPLLSEGQWSWDTCKAHVIKNTLTFSHSQSSVHTTLPTEDPAAHTRQSATVMYLKNCP